MHKISKGLYMGSVGTDLGIADVLVITGYVGIRTGFPDGATNLFYLAIVPLVYGWVFMTVLLYKSWDAIQDVHARTTPGKAIGFLFIPFFDFYWVFPAIWGLAKDFNSYLRRKSIYTPVLPEGLFLTYCILSFAGWIPIVGLVVVVVNYFIGLIMVNALCDGINALAAKESR